MRIRPILLGAITVALAGCGHTAATTPTPTAATCPPVEKGDAVYAKIGGATITQAEVDRMAGQKIYDAREQALDSLIDDRVIGDAAKAAGKPVEEFLRDTATARVPEVSEAEAKKFFEDNKDRLPAELADKSWTELKPVIVRGLTGEKRKQAVSDIIAELREKAGVQVLLEPPRVEVAATGPARGPSTAKVTIVEFSDFQCPYCAKGRKTMDEVVKAYGDKVRVVYRDFPLPFHEHAEQAAEAGQCANEQGKFWQLHDWMFDHQDTLDGASLSGAARQLGLDDKKFDACLNSGKYAGTVAANAKDGERAGVTGTPAYFINGAFVSGAQPFDKFKSQIDRELAK